MEPNEALSVNLTDLSTTDYGYFALNVMLNGKNQFFTQINHSLYAMDEGWNVVAFDLETIDMNLSTVTSIPQDNSSLDCWPCLASDANRGYIFVIGGGGGNVLFRAFRISDGVWINGLNLTDIRLNALCIFDDETDILYAIGGEGQQSVEIMEMTLFAESNGTDTSEWTLLEHELPEDYVNGRAHLHRDDILLFAGIGDAVKARDPSEFYVIERFGDHFMYRPDGLSSVIGRLAPLSIIVNDIFYVFSGSGTDGTLLTSWEWVDLNVNESWYDFIDLLVI